MIGVSSGGTTFAMTRTFVWWEELVRKARRNLSGAQTIVSAFSSQEQAILKISKELWVAWYPAGVVILYSDAFAFGFSSIDIIFTKKRSIVAWGYRKCPVADNGAMKFLDLES